MYVFSEAESNSKKYLIADLMFSSAIRITEIKKVKS